MSGNKVYKTQPTPTVKNAKFKSLEIVITDKAVKDGVLWVYGTNGGGFLATIKLYEAQIKKDGEVIRTFLVTRDSWYSRGIVHGTNRLINRTFEPPGDQPVTYGVVPLKYPHGTQIEAYVLTINGSKTLKAKPFDRDMNYHLDANGNPMVYDMKKGPIDDARKNLDAATGVMIHIGGWYNNSEKDKFVGSYGCFGIVPEFQAGTWEDMVTVTKLYHSTGNPNLSICNDYYKQLIDFIKNSAAGRVIKVTIIPRSSYQKYHDYAGFN